MGRNYHYAAVGWAFETAEGLGLPPAESVVLYAYAACVNADPSTPAINGMAWPSVDTLMAKTRLSRRSLLIATAALVKRGLLIPAGRVGKTGRVPRYLLAGHFADWKAGGPGAEFPAADVPLERRPKAAKPLPPGVSQPGFLEVEDTGIDPERYSPPPETPDYPGVRKSLTAREREFDLWGRREAAKAAGRDKHGFYRDTPAPPSAAEPPPSAPPAEERVTARRFAPRYPEDYARR